MAHPVCPWWVGYLIASPIRRLFHNPEEILGPHIHEGMTILEPGPGMGFFTIPLARLVGPTGHVVAVDVQSRMIEALKRRARNAGVQERIDARTAPRDSLSIQDLDGKLDFTLAFAVVHEFPSAQHFFAEVARGSKPGAHVLLAEPRGHVDEARFQSELEAAGTCQLTVISRPKLRLSHAALLLKNSE
jgi:ubiquinone/menaquinone biosynthesis C-methylase UbiE